GAEVDGLKLAGFYNLGGEVARVGLPALTGAAVADGQAQHGVRAACDERGAGAGPVGGEPAEGRQDVDPDPGLTGPGNDAEVGVVHGVAAPRRLLRLAFQDVVPGEQAAGGVHEPVQALSAARSGST